MFSVIKITGKIKIKDKIEKATGTMTYPQFEKIISSITI